MVWRRIGLVIRANVVAIAFTCLINLNIASAEDVYVLRAEDFPQIQADTVICDEIKLPCLKPADGERVIALPKPISIISFSSLPQADFKPPKSANPARLGGYSPIFAFARIPSASATKSWDTDKNAVTPAQMEQIVYRLRPYNNTIASFAWNNDLNWRQVTFESDDDSHLVANGLCLTPERPFGPGPMRNCLIYRFWKGDEQFDVSAIGAKFGRSLTGADGPNNDPTAFLRRVGPSLADAIAASRFLQGEPSDQLILRGYGARVIFNRAIDDDHSLYQAQTGMLEISVETPPGDWQDSRFDILTRTTIDTYVAGDDTTSPRWRRKIPAIQIEWEAETSRIVTKLAADLCRIYGNRQLESELYNLNQYRPPDTIETSVTCKDLNNKGSDLIVPKIQN